MDGQSDSRWPAWGAFAASFAVYFLPIVGPHGWWFLGTALGVALSEAPDKGFAWVAADLAAAAAAQAAAFGLFYWVLRGRPWLRALVLFPPGILLFITLQWAYLIAIPSLFLIEDDTAPEITDWEEHCALPEYSLVDHMQADRAGIARAKEAWVIDDDSELGLLRLPNCVVEPLGFKWSNVSPLVHHAVAGGGAIYSLQDRGSTERRLFLKTGPGTEPRTLAQPPDTGYPKPVLSPDGAWIGWLQRIGRAKGKSGVPQVRLENVETGEERVIPLEKMTPASFELMEIDPAAGTVTLTRHSRNPREFLSVNLEGEVVWGPFRPATVDADIYSFRKVDGGFVAHDSYQEDEAYRIEWSLPGGDGLYRIPLGRRVSALAVSPDGRYIAVSVNTTLSIGNIDDAVFVIRASDGAEVFRRYLKVYTRSAVAFLGDGFFAYTESYDRPDRLRVLKIPSPGS